jgi:hypothetical protein
VSYFSPRPALDKPRLSTTDPEPSGDTAFTLNMFGKRALNFIQHIFGLFFVMRRNRVAKVDEDATVLRVWLQSDKGEVV